MLARILLQKFAGCETQVIFQSQDVIGIQKLIQIGAAPIETRNLGMTGKTEAIFCGDGN
jgi:hypothetical protein